MNQPLFDSIDKRVAREKEDGDRAFFSSLLLKLEYLTKIVVSGVTACIGDDADRRRYSLEHKLVRSGSMGDWTTVLEKALVGSPANFLISDARILTKDLTEMVGYGDWRHSAVTSLHRVATTLGAETILGPKVSLRQGFAIGVEIRNKFSHGALTATQCSASCPDLADALTAIVQHLVLFSLPWAYLHRNLSGKYRVSPLLNNSHQFDRLRRTRDARLPNGVCFYPNDQGSSDPVYVPLIFSDPDVLDIALPNGKHHDRDHSFETLSYVTNDAIRQDGAKWSLPPERLPSSETEGKVALEPLGNSFSNAPPRPVGHVARNFLEESLRNELMNLERHPVVTLTGPGGIGKTAIALTVIHEIAQEDPPPYDTILWISARDIDLLESGPKPVSRKVFKQRDISRVAAGLLEPTEKNAIKGLQA